MTLDMFSRQQQEKTHIIAEYYLNFSFYDIFDNFGIFQEIRVRMIFSKFFEGSFTHIKNQMIFFYMKWLQLIKTTLRWQKRIQQLKVTITCVNVKKKKN